MADLKVQKVEVTTKFNGIGEIKEAIREGRIMPGEQIVIYADGHDTIWDVIGKDCEELVDPNLAHSITIQLHGLLEGRPFDENGSNIWKKSSIRAYLNSEEFAARFADLTPHLAKVRKDTDGKQTEDTFFLLSKEEYDPDKTPYPYYKDKKHRVKYNDEGYANWHWMRSAGRGNALTTWYVNTSGIAGHINASTSLHSTPACVIGA